MSSEKAIYNPFPRRAYFTRIDQSWNSFSLFLLNLGTRASNGYLYDMSELINLFQYSMAWKLSVVSDCSWIVLLFQFFGLSLIEVCSARCYDIINLTTSSIYWEIKKRHSESLPIIALLLAVFVLSTSSPYSAYSIYITGFTPHRT